MATPRRASIEIELRWLVCCLRCLRKYLHLPISVILAVIQMLHVEVNDGVVEEVAAGESLEVVQNVRD